MNLGIDRIPEKYQRHYCSLSHSLSSSILVQRPIIAMMLCIIIHHYTITHCYIINYRSTHLTSCLLFYLLITFLYCTIFLYLFSLIPLCYYSESHGARFSKRGCIVMDIWYVSGYTIRVRREDHEFSSRCNQMQSDAILIVTVFKYNLILVSNFSLQLTTHHFYHNIIHSPNHLQLTISDKYLQYLQYL